jgi:aminoglycoside 3'-phosphotransferase II
MPTLRATHVLSLLPTRWQRELRDCPIQRVQRGKSGAQLFRFRDSRCGELYLKVAEPNDPVLRAELERTRWLMKAGASVPEVLWSDGRSAAVLMTALPGSHPEQQLRQPVAAIVDQLARGLHALHAIPIADCSFDETTATRLALARQMIAQGQIHSENFDERNRRIAPIALYRRLVATMPQLPPDLVVVHGDATFDNILIDDEGHVGFIDCGRSGRGDRYLDLEAMTSDIEDHFGSQWIEPFARCYGITLDLGKLRFFDDLYELF